MVWGLWRFGVAVDHDFGRPAVPTRGMGRVLVAQTLPYGFMGGMGCIAVEIAAVGPAGRVKWREIFWLGDVFWPRKHAAARAVTQQSSDCTSSFPIDITDPHYSEDTRRMERSV